MLGPVRYSMYPINVQMEGGSCHNRNLACGGERSWPLYCGSSAPLTCETSIAEDTEQMGGEVEEIVQGGSKPILGRMFDKRAQQM